MKKIFKLFSLTNKYLVFYLFFIIFLSFPVPSSAAESLVFIHSDHLGSSSWVTDTTGKLISEERYYPYGSTRSQTGTLPTERQFTGQISNTSQTGLYYYNARYYSPLLAKFTQADSTNDQLNRYTYVGNNPVNYIDISGDVKIPPICDLDCTLRFRYSYIQWASNLDFRFFPNYRNPVFKKIENDFTQEYSLNKMNSVDKVKAISEYIRKNIDYSKTGQEMLDLAAQKSAGSGWGDYLNTTKYKAGQSRTDYALAKQERLEYLEVYYRATRFYSPAVKYKKNLFTCDEYAQMTSTWIQNNVPEASVYYVTAGSGDVHAFNIVVVEGKVFVVDTTNYITKMSLFEYKNFIKDWWGYDWDTLGYNPRWSSKDTSEEKFEEIKEGALTSGNCTWTGGCQAKKGR